MKLAKIIIFMLMILIVMTSVFALGIAPAKRNVDFTENLRQDVKFTIYSNDNRDVDVIIYPRGIFADYVTLEKTSLHIPAHQNSVSVTYSIDIPFTASKPGINVLEIVVEEASSEYTQDLIVGGKIAVVHQLVMKTSREGKHADVIFTSNNPGFDEDLILTYALLNEGTEDIEKFRAETEVYDEEAKLIGKEEYEFSSLAVGSKRKETRTFGKKLAPGKYKAVTKVFYEEKAIAKDVSFVVGNPYIEIEAISSANFNLGRINRLDIAVYNRWNKQIENVFGEVTVTGDYDRIYSVFKTASDDVLPFAGNTLYGYWDTSNIGIGLYNLLVKIDYGIGITEKTFNVKVFQNEIVASSISGKVVVGETDVKSSKAPILTLAFIILMIVNILLIIYIRKNRKPPEQLNSFIIFLTTALIIIMRSL